MVEIRALSESSSLEAVAKVAGAPHTPTLHRKSKISREYKRKGEKHQERTRDEEKNIKRVQTMGNITGDEERTKQNHNFFVKLPR